MNIVHELGHLLSWIYNGRQDPKELIEALQAESERKDQTIPKDKRKLIYEMEKHDTKYWDYIVTELGINISKNELKVRKLLDIWIYRMYYLQGDFPSLERIRGKREELTRKYAEKERTESRRILQRQITRSTKTDKRLAKASKNVRKNWAHEKTKK
jgi:intein/homing endonuclease